MNRPVQIALLLALAVGTARAQQAGPITPVEPPVIKRIPLHPEVPPPKLPADEIIARFTANEARYGAAYLKYGFLETIRVDELAAPAGEAAGNFEVELAVSLTASGERMGRVLRRTNSTLKYLHLTTQDLEVLAEMPLFPLAGEAAAQYNFTYRGTQKLDELMTYVFQVEPKSITIGHPYFSGLVWVDNEDLAIVRSYGEFKTGEPRAAGALPFSFFDTYRENTEGKYWFPVYIRSDDDITQGGNQVPIQLVIQSSGFRPGQPVLPPAATAH